MRPNPVTCARKPQVEDTDPDIRFRTEDEVEALIRAVPDDHLGSTDRALYLTAAMTGSSAPALKAAPRSRTSSFTFGHSGGSGPSAWEVFEQERKVLDAAGLSE